MGRVGGEQAIEAGSSVPRSGRGGERRRLGRADFAVELATNHLHSSRSHTTLLLPALRVSWEQGPHLKPRLLAFPRALGLAVLLTQGLFCPVPCCGRHPSPDGITLGAGRGAAVSEGPAPQRKATVDLAPFLWGPLSSPSPARGARQATACEVRKRAPGAVRQLRTAIGMGSAPRRNLS